MFTPEFRQALAAIVREVVIEELRDFNAELWQGMDRALNEAFAPCVTLLKIIDKNQCIVSDTNTAVAAALRELQDAVIAKIGQRPPDDDEPWRASLRNDDEQAD